jgi:hypothetical protein
MAASAILPLTTSAPGCRLAPTLEKMNKLQEDDSDSSEQSDSFSTGNAADNLEHEHGEQFVGNRAFR